MKYLAWLSVGKRRRKLNGSLDDRLTPALETYQFRFKCLPDEIHISNQELDYSIEDFNGIPVVMRENLPPGNYWLGPIR